MTNEELEKEYDETFIFHPNGIFKEGKIVHPEYKPLTHEEVKKFILKVAELSRQEGVREGRKVIEMNAKFFRPIGPDMKAYNSVLQNGDLDTMYNLGFNEARQRILASLTNTEKDFKPSGGAGKYGDAGQEIDRPEITQPK